jgi:hypothetical protein
MNTKKTKRPLSDWQAGQIRITAFFPQEQFDQRRDFWAELGLGEPALSQKKKGEVLSQGQVLNNWMVLKSDAFGRVDWVYVPEPLEEETAESGPRFVGQFDRAVDEFLEFISDWIQEKRPSLERLALGAQALLPVTERVEGYAQLSAYLPFELDGTNASDFSYQINRPRQSTAVTGATINRLTQWSVYAFTRASAQVSVGPIMVPPKIRQDPIGHACQMTIDINTAIDYQHRLEPEQTLPLLAEFAGFVKEIVRDGDVS